MRFQVFALVFLVAAAVMASVSKAQAFYFFPSCESPAVESKIINRFNWAESHTWHDGVRIVSIDQAVERPAREYGFNPILRRYCAATTSISKSYSARRPNYESKMQSTKIQ